MMEANHPGAVLGSRRGKAGGWASDFAEEDDLASVALVFAYGERKSASVQ